jgi:hypothetical protein
MNKRDPSLYSSPLLDLSRITRRRTPLRVAFLHRPRTNGGSGPLASIVRARQALAFDLLLYAHAAAPLAKGHPIRATAAQWMRSIGIEETTANRVSVSRSWAWLEESQLIRRHRAGRERGVEILREDGSGRPWRDAYLKDEPYFGVPLSYWRGGYGRALALPAKAVLLIGLSLQSQEEEFFELPLERASAWYGLSTSTLRRGLDELRARRILRRWVEQRETEKSPLGYTYDQRYALNDLSEFAGLDRPEVEGDGPDIPLAPEPEAG